MCSSLNFSLAWASLSWSSLCNYSHREILDIIGIVEVLSLPEIWHSCANESICMWTQVFNLFLPRLLATEDKPFWPQRKEEQNLGSNKDFKTFCFLDSPGWTAVVGKNSAQGWICLESPSQPQWTLIAQWQSSSSVYKENNTDHLPYCLFLRHQSPHMTSFFFLHWVKPLQISRGVIL